MIEKIVASYLGILDSSLWMAVIQKYSREKLLLRFMISSLVTVRVDPIRRDGQGSRFLNAISRVRRIYFDHSEFGDEVFLKVRREDQVKQFLCIVMI